MKNLIILMVTVIRIYFVFKVIQGLYFNHFNLNYSLDNVQWYIYVLFIDMYTIKIFDNSNSGDIYFEKKDNEK
jgi:hypothetical protein